jgi:hypothetical protein
MRYGQIVTIRPNVIFNRGASYCAALPFGMRDDLLPPCRSHCPELDWMDLEVVDSAGGSTVWEETFQTEQAALSEVLRTIEVEGISCFLLYPVQKLH